MNKDNITNFSDLKKKADEKLNKDDKTPLADPSILADGNVQELLSSLGITMDESAIEEMMNLKSVDDIADFVQSGKISFGDMQNMVENLRQIEDKFKKEKKTYRAFSQWISYRKPYDLSTLCSIEQIQEMAAQVDVEYSKLDSKNAIIEKIKPHLFAYFKKQMQLLDEKMMQHVGKVIYSNGRYEVANLLEEEAEIQIDYLQRKGILSRINENGVHYLVLPNELYELSSDLDFQELSRYNALNSLINTMAIAFANSYGAYPKELLLKRLELEGKAYFEDLSIENPESYVETILSRTFVSKQSLNALYSTVVLSEDYIHHGIIEFTKYLIDIQNENIKDYKMLTLEQIRRRGSMFFYEDSIYLNQVMELLGEHYAWDKEEQDQIKNMIYIFSYLEFEPSLVLQMLEVRYQLPSGELYYKLVDVLKNYYKTGEKWILKGHTSFEVNNKNADFDASKIVKLDFIDK